MELNIISVGIRYNCFRLILNSLSVYENGRNMLKAIRRIVVCDVRFSMRINKTCSTTFSGNFFFFIVWCVRVTDNRRFHIHVYDACVCVLANAALWPCLSHCHRQRCRRLPRPRFALYCILVHRTSRGNTHANG